MGKLMLVNATAGEETRIAILDEGNLDNFFVERAGQEQIVGNIYKARVAAVEQSLQAAFVDFGWERQGFLHLSDVAPHWYNDASVARKSDKMNVPITAALRRGQEILIQVSKEGIRNKAPAVTTFLSIPGRYLVLMPYIKRHGVSKKIADEEEREELHKVLDKLNPPKDMGIIVRTAAANRSQRDIHRDLNYLLRLWTGIQKQATTDATPSVLYRESDMIIRIVRDVFNADIERVLVDNPEAHQRILDFMAVTMPLSRKAVELYSDGVPLFTKYQVEEQIERIHRNRVSLPGGGSIVIEQTEALVAIDVNSGRFKQEANVEETAYQINLQAAGEIGRQIRLRDLGGLIISDFIDMRDETHKRDVERRLYETLKNDRARTKMLRMSRFCIVEMTRQRVRRNIEFTDYQTCPNCNGSGQIRNTESSVLEALRRIRTSAAGGKFKRLVVRMNPERLVRLQNDRRQELTDVERLNRVRIVLEPAPELVDNVDIKCYKH